MKRTEVVCNEEVAQALEDRVGIVALESTIIAHGMPYPDNLETARLLEETIRKAGAVPATCAVIDGVLKAGLNADELEVLATEPSLKLSRRDLPFALLRRVNGATTVAATMLIAQAAGIRVFATGGIGGVHRAYDRTLDISADLYELGRTSVAVVTAGAKAILDIPNTLEVLESLSVPVIGYRTDDFPAFYSRSSGVKVPFRMDDASEIARFLQLKWDNGLDGGVVIANPLPQESSIPEKDVEEYVNQALLLAGRSNVSGKELTPFLLSRIKELSQGESLSSNKALALNNARLGAEIALAFATR